MTDDDVPAILSRGAFYMSDGTQGWTEIGWTEGPFTFLSPSPSTAFEPAFAPGPRTLTVTMQLSRAEQRHIRRWLLRAGNPRPLCIDGHEYHRRQKARWRRRRRNSHGR